MKLYRKRIAATVDTEVHKKIFTILAGINGVGKSSMMGVLKSASDSYGTIIDPDDYARKYGGNLSGGKEAIKDIEFCLKNGLAFTEETTLSGNHIINTAKRAKSLGYEVHLIYIGLNSAQDSIDRVANRVKRGGHNIPNDTIIRRYNSRFVQLSKILEYCDSAKFYTNYNGYQLVATYDGATATISQIVDTPPAWLDEFFAYMGVE